MKNWHQYLGLPHQFGADPDDGVACDCVIMVWNVLRDAGVAHPPYDRKWLEMASRGEWAALKQQWSERTKPCQQDEYALTLFEEPGSLGLGIIVDEGLLFPHHKRGVHWLPNRKVARLKYRTFNEHAPL